MYELLKPKIVLPVHGDKRNIRAQRRFALECGVGEVVLARNGDVMLLNGGKIENIGEIPTDIIGVDRNQLTSLNSQLIKNRKRIAYNSSLYISVVFDEKWNLLDLQISSIDILEEEAFKKLAEEIKEDVMRTLPTEVVKLNRRAPQIEEYIRAKIRKMVYKATDIKPVTYMHFYKIGSTPQTEPLDKE